MNNVIMYLDSCSLFTLIEQPRPLDRNNQCSYIGALVLLICLSTCVCVCVCVRARACACVSTCAHAAQQNTPFLYFILQFDTL